MWLRAIQSPFSTAAMGTSAAVLVSHPIELVKTRLQLQGELIRTSRGEKVYKGPVHGAWLVLRNEGISGMYRGILAGIAYQIVMNGIRYAS